MRRPRRLGLSGRQVACLGGWLVAGPLALSAAARLVHLDEKSSLLLLIDGLTPWLWLPALGSFAIGLSIRRPLLSVVSGAVAALYLVWTVPGLGLPPATPRTGSAVQFRLFSANLNFHNADTRGIAKEISTVRPDVIVLQELSSRTAMGPSSSGVLDEYPYAVVRPREGAFGIGVWSRLPLVDAQAVNVAGVTMIRATLLVSGQALQLWAVHVVAPVGPDRDRWQRQLAWLGQAARDDQPLIMAGDFNATRWHRGLARLLADGMADAHERRGRGLAATWPRNRWPLPPLMRLDHVLVSREIGVRAVWEGSGLGSDHRPVVADLVVQ